jgi:hypothetical protein
MTNVQTLFRRALLEKVAFMPMGAAEQAAGPDGQPVQPGGAPPMDPGMGGAPMDPAMGGAPMDPAMGGAPMDPGMGGAPPLDPAMGGMPGEGESNGLTPEDAETVDKITERTMNIVRETLEMVGKAKTPKPEEGAGVPPPPPAPTEMPGPVTGQPGFDPAAMSGPLKLAQVLARRLR